VESSFAVLDASRKRAPYDKRLERATAPAYQADATTCRARLPLKRQPLGGGRHIALTTRRIGGHMRRVTGIGGIFFKANDAASLQAWYKRHLGIDVQVWGGAAFDWTDAEGKPVAGTTAWCIDPQDSDHFAPSSAPFMVNYRVEDLHALVKVLKEEGCNVLEKIDDSEYGKFAWVIDPEGNKVELWQPPQGQ
jgi:predicted enzyme related to lactoylglutathione lyase